MSEQGSSGDTAAVDGIAKRARARQARDKALVEASREGDRAAFGKIYDSWVDNVYDRAVNAGASAAEAREITEQTFLTVWLNLGRLRQPAAIGAKILQVAQRRTSSLVKPSTRPQADPESAGVAEDRLTRATDVAKTAGDHDVATVLREAATALDDRTREVLDLHYRQGLTASEVAAVTGAEADAVKETIVKLPTALSVLTRARVLWRGGRPLDDELAELLKNENITQFDAATVRTINKFAKDHDRARARSLIAVAPFELFAAIPLADAPAGLKTTVAEKLVSEGVAMDGSAFVKRNDRGEMLSKPRDKRADADAPRLTDVRSVADSRDRSAVDEQANEQAGSAAAAGAVATGEATTVAALASSALATVADAPPKTKVSERLRARKSGAGGNGPGRGTGGGMAGVTDGAVVGSLVDTDPVADAGVAGATDGPIVGSLVDTDPVADAGTAPGASPGSMATDATNSWLIGASTSEPAPPLGEPVAGPSGEASDSEDLDAQAAGKAAAMGSPYVRPLDGDGPDGDGPDGASPPARVIAGADHLEREPNRKKPLLIAGAAAAAVILLGGVAFAARGSGGENTAAGPRPTNPDQKVTVAPTTVAVVTTTTIVVTTTAAPATTSTAESPTTAAGIAENTTPAKAGSGGGGGGGASTPTTPVTQPNPTANIAQTATGTFGLGGETNIEHGYAMDQATTPKLSWNIVASGPFTLAISGPGNVIQPDGHSSGVQLLCPGPYSADQKNCDAPAGGYQYELIVLGADGSTRSFSKLPLTIT